jgi:flavin reductase (DIM6/NTAB) family NADH-FMN oxidoreductase RutF
MRLTHAVRSTLKRLIFGPIDYPQQCPIGMRDPQSEVTVWLHGLGAPRDITYNHLMASGSPFTIGVGFDEGWHTAVRERKRLSLKFHERSGERRLLGEIGIQLSSILPAGNQQLCLFQVRSCRNYCLPRLRLWARYLQYARIRSRAPESDVPITAREIHAMIVFYSCPRPVVLVSAADGCSRNIFPMNLMGTIGDGYYCFALNTSRQAASLVERSGRIALSSVPLEQTSVAFQLGKNHRKTSIDLSQLPFMTRPSPGTGLPVPKFSLRVRELQVESVQKIGSHTLFVARIVGDERWEDGLQLFVVHGIYQAWRQARTTNLQNALQ